VTINLSGVNSTTSYTIASSNSNNNLNISPSSKIVTGTGSASFSITSTTGQTGSYTIYFGPTTSCFKAITVNVIN
jgi:hypothetical protein